MDWSAAQFSPDSRRIALRIMNREVIVYNLVNRAVVAAGRSRGWDPGLPAGRASARRREQREGVRKVPDPRGRDWSTHPDDPLADQRRRDRVVPGRPHAGHIGLGQQDLPVRTARGNPATLTAGVNNQGVSASFHPAGTLLANNDWSGDLRIWDPMLCQPLLRLTSSVAPAFSRDGRIVVGQEDRLIVYRSDPALEYRTLVSSHREAIGYEGARSATTAVSWPLGANTASCSGI